MEKNTEKIQVQQMGQHPENKHACIYNQGSPVNVKHGARCAMQKVGGKKKPKEGGILIYRYIFVVGLQNLTIN